MAIKKYICKSPFSSPRFGNVNPKDLVYVEETIGARMQEEGLLETEGDKETKPAPKAKKETKPAPKAKKATK